ncbi:MAG: hypothetical protein PF904_21030 [Kiritimatiellae bacterium]|jgi:hypothetical protein|nr:hypothetical protein [Kiritimatiellia bacterium]
MASQHKNVNLGVADRDFKYFIFDWDDNILHMPTRIYLEKKDEDGNWIDHSVSTAFFAVIRGDTENYRAPDGDWDKAFKDFQDYDGNQESGFLKDTRDALNRVLSGKVQPAPSYTRLKETLIEGRLFAIVTARGHASDSIKEAVKLFIDMALSKDDLETMMANLRGYRATFDGERKVVTDQEVLNDYLSLNRYHAVTNPGFKKWLNDVGGEEAMHENPKQFAIRDFVEHVARLMEKSEEGLGHRSISVGFSDDDVENVKAVEKYIQQELSRHFPSVKFVVYDTSDSVMKNGRKVVVAGQLDFDF